MLESYHIILASASPRRKTLLEGLQIPFDVCVLPDIDESYPHNLLPVDIPVFIACKKAAAYTPHMQANDLIITADTIVALGNEILGKPQDEDDALRMLKKLSGRTHTVVTGVALTAVGRQTCFAVTSDVEFAALEEEDIRRYVRTCRPFDKAGGYGIQEWIGYIGVRAIHGSFYNVMGLPVQRLYHELKTF
jgi:septum formation protein